MQPITLTDEQRAFRAAIRQMAEERFAPRAAGIDATGEFPWDNFKDCVSMDLPGMAIPAEYGGSAADHVTRAIMVEELARVCASTSLMMAINGLSSTPIVNWGSDDLKARYLPRIVSGELQASYCLSETDAGSDVAAMQTRAERDGDSYVLNGAKHWITNAGVSDIYVVFAKSDPGAGARGISCFLVEREHGLRIGRLERKMGMHGSPTGEVLDHPHACSRPTASVDEGRLGDCHARSTAAVRRSPLRPWVSPRARSTTQSATKERKAFRPSDCRVPGLRRSWRWRTWP